MAYEGEIIELEDLVPERRPVTRFPRNGETVLLSGYPDNRRCPAGIRANVARAYRAYSKRREEDDAAAGVLLNRDMLLAVIVGLESDEADVLAADDDNTAAILTALGWLKTVKSDDEGEAQGEPENQSTTVTSSPDSTSAMEPAIG